MQKKQLSQDIAVVKEASEKSTDLLGKIVRPLAAATGIAGVAGLYGYFSGKQDQKRHKEELAKSLQATFSADKAFSKDPSKFAQLFGELSVMSPSVAKNPNLASKLIKERLSKGFDLDDVHKLSVIEGSGGASRSVPSPGSAARGAAAGALEKVVGFFGPQEWPEVRKAMGEALSQINERQTLREEAKHIPDDPAQRADLAKQLAAEMLARRRGMHKQSSDMSVSDECLGEMLSDRVSLIKAAAPSAFTQGVGALKSHLAYIAPALALGGGIGLIKLVHDKLEDSTVKNQAEANFAKLMRTSDIAKGNPEVARESFETLKMVAPILATRPGVLKSFVENQANSGMLPNYEQVKALAESGQAVERSKSGKGFFSGVKDVLNFADLPVKPGKKG